MYQQQGHGNFLSAMTPAVRLILLTNVVLFIFTYLYNGSGGIRLQDILGLHYPSSDLFKPYQIVTHMFMHANFIHLAFNMYALWMFGKYIEMRWGASRFFIYYMVTGLGAAALHTLVQYIEIQSLMSEMSQSDIDSVMREGSAALQAGKNFQATQLAELNFLINIPTVGASGAVFGILLAFGMMYPDVRMYLFFIPVPIKAKWLVIGYGVLELINGMSNVQGDNVAHFAHLGGMLFGFIFIKVWGLTDNRNRRN